MRETIFEQMKSAEWEPYIRFVFTRVTLVDESTTRSVYLMRRRAPDGGWQFRRMTDDEFWKYLPWGIGP